MIKPALITLALASAFAAMTAHAAPAPAIDTPIAREAGEGPRGGDNERPGDRQRRGGRVMIELPTSGELLAREGGVRRGDRGRGGYMDETPTAPMQLARERGEAPRGADRRGGRYMEEAPSAPMQLAREAGEGPRGGDNERPGDRQRRGGRV